MRKMLLLALILITGLSVSIVEVDAKNSREKSEAAYAFFGDTSIPFDERGRPWGWYFRYREGTYRVYTGAVRNNIRNGTLIGWVNVDGLDVVFIPLEGVNVIGTKYYIGLEEPLRPPGRRNSIVSNQEDALWMCFFLEVTIEEF